ncbi:MAG: flavodoxin family protein [Lentisphaeria bacterium]|jgi:multimeric flavodoxin WrbA|nr:flavodoxin family protein [Lentisphaeria bacterium]
MNVLLLNGSPRKNGNTAHALRAIEDGLKQHHAVESLNVYDFTFRPCRNCDACKRNGGNCIQADDTVKIIDKVTDADLVIFGSPVYWWGISAQLKDVVDKFYSRDTESADGTPTLRTKKKIGIVACGAETVDDIEYRLISDQFHCIAKFLGWEVVLDESVSAAAADDLAKDGARLAELTAAAAKL